MAGDNEVVEPVGQEGPDVPPELSLEQRQAIALANARRRAMAKRGAEESGLGRSVVRQLGLTARAAGPAAAGAAMGAALGAPSGIGAIPGAGIGALTMSIVGLADKLQGTNYLDQIMDKLGLPKPESEEEQFAGAVTESMANMGSIAGGAAGLLKGGALSRGAQGVAETLASNPGMGVASAATGGGAQEVVRQAGGSPTEQFLANVAGSAIAPAGIAAGKAVGKTVGNLLGDVGHAVGAGFGRQKSIERLARDAVRTMKDTDIPEVRDALRNATTYVPGAKPTVAEAIAEKNLQLPDKQVGGELVRLQENITGAKGAADILPSKVKAQGAALTAHADKLRELTAPLRERAFENARLRGGIDPQSVRWDITIKQMDPGVEGYPLAMRLLQSVRSDINRAAAKNASGKIDPEVLYGIRQTAGDRLKALQKEMPRPKEAVGQKALRAIQQSIDLAMERGGATGWRSYLKDFEEGMQPLNKHAARLAEASRIAQGVQTDSPGALVQETLPHIPTLLHRPTMFVNFLLSKIGKEAVSPVTREIATRMQDPEQFLQLMSRPEAAPAKQAMYDVLINAAILSNLIQKHQAAPQPPTE